AGRWHDRAGAMPALLSLFAERHAKPAGEVLNILPGDAAGRRAARSRPFKRLALQWGGVYRDAIIIYITVHHCAELILAAGMKPEPKAEAVRQRPLLLDRLAGIDGARPFVLDHIARHQVPPIRGGIEDDVVGPSLDAAFEHRLERLIRSVLGIEGEIVAEHQKPEWRAAQ